MNKLGSILSEVVGNKNLLTVQPGGNHGDSLIYHGFNKYIQDTKIDQVPLDNGRFRFDAPNKTISINPASMVSWGHQQWKYLRHKLTEDISAIYIHGGGNFNDLWKVGIQCYESAARYFNCPIIIGPQSCQFTETNPTEIFRKIDNDTYFFCREKYSYDIIEKAIERVENVSVYLEKDTALNLEIEDLPTSKLTDEYTLLAMRMDKDSTTPLIEERVLEPVLVNDISKMEPTYEKWIDAASRAQHIYTDRLHVAILGNILGKSITWFNTGYHKNKGVYEYSLSNEPNINFCYL